ncbi:MAG TPA: hypothetical protein VI488_07765 [Candidatus Angelobacter sp.]
MRQSFSCLLIAATSLSAAALAWQQASAPSDVPAESHHRLIFENELSRVFAVSIPPHQEIYVRHQHNFLTITLEGGRMVMWTEGTSPQLAFPVNTGDTRFFLGGVAMGTRNDGNSEYKNITVEFLDPRVTNYGFQYYRTGGRNWDYGSSALAPPVNAESAYVHALSLQRAVVRDVRLLPGGQLAPPDQPVQELLIAVTDLSLTSTTGSAVYKRTGEIAWLEGRTSGLINQGAVPARFVVLELKR